MSDFVPGEPYRIDIIGTDESVLVDSWNNQIRADVVTKSGLIQVDTNTGKVYGPFVGNIEDDEGEIIYDSLRKEFTAIFKGDLLNSRGQVLVDSITSTVTADLIGNIYNENQEIILNINQKVLNSSLKGDVVSNTGDIIIDSTTKTINGNLNGNIYNSEGEVVFDYYKSIFLGNVKGDLLDSNNNVIYDSVTQTLNGNVKGDIYNSNNEIIVDINTNTIHASGFYGDFYGNFSGSLIPDSVVYGTFSGEFNGTHRGEYYGSFMGDMSGSFRGKIEGDLLGDTTGTHVGDVIGNILSLDKTPVTYYSEDLNSHFFLGGISFPTFNGPEDAAKAPILVVGDNRNQSALSAHIHYYDGSPVITLDTSYEDTYKATFFGRVDGDIWKNDQPILTKSPFTTIHANQNQLRLNAENGVIEVFGSRIKKMISITNSDPIETIQAYRGTFQNKMPIQAGDRVGAFSVDVWDGEGFKQGGAFGFIANPDNNHNTNNNFYPTVFGVVVSNGITNPIENSTARLEFNNKGILSAPMFKVGSKTFAEIDSLRPDEGTIVFNSSSKKFIGWTGTQWVDLH